MRVLGQNPEVMWRWLTAPRSWWLPRPTLVAPGIEGLSQVLVSGKLWARLAAVEELGRMRSARAVAPLCRAMADRDSRVRHQAVVALCRTLSDDLFAVKDESARVLTGMGVVAINPLWHVLVEGNLLARETAASVLARIGRPEAIPPLCAALEDGSYIVREHARKGLARIGAPAIGSLRPLLDRPDADLRRIVVETLARMDTLQVLPPLFRALADGDVAVAHAAQDALVHIGAPAIGGLCTALQHERVGPVARWALVRIGPQAVAPLCQVLRQGGRDARIHAAHALGELGAVEAIPVLCQALSYIEVNAAPAREALVKIGTPAVEPLCLALQHEWRKVRSEAARTLGDIADNRAVVPLCRALDDRDATVRARAAYSLGQIKDERAVAVLCRGVEDKDVSVRRSCTAALGAVGHPQAVGALCLRLEDREPSVRRTAALALRRLEQRAALPALRARLRPLAGEHDLGVRAAVDTAIQSIENATAATRSLPRAAPADTLTLDGLPRVIEEVPSPAGRPRSL